MIDDDDAAAQFKKDEFNKVCADLRFTMMRILNNDPFYVCKFSSPCLSFDDLSTRYYSFAGS